MRRFAFCTDNIGNVPVLSGLMMAACLLWVTGCGSKVAEQNGSNTTPKTPVASPKASPTDVVSQFLDRVRRGGEDSDAGKLLTSRAQSELNRIGRSVQPIGSPDAFFNVTRSEAVPGEKDSMLVHSIWSEPAADGTKSDYQVVWAVQLENGDWRISGLAMELVPNQPPTIIDFENGDLMAQLLDDGSESSESSQSPESQAAALPETVIR